MYILYCEADGIEVYVVTVNVLHLLYV